MSKILVLWAVVIIAIVVAAACGGDEGEMVSSPVSGVGPGITIGEALTSDLSPSTWVRRQVPGGGRLRPDDDRRPYERGCDHLVD